MSSPSPAASHRHATVTPPPSSPSLLALTSPFFLCFALLFLLFAQTLKGSDEYPEPTVEQKQDPASKYCDVVKHGHQFVNPRREQIQVRL